MLNQDYFARDADKPVEEERKADDSFEVLEDSMSDGDKERDGDQQVRDDMKERFRQQLNQTTDSFDHLSQYDPDDQFL